MILMYNVTHVLNKWIHVIILETQIEVQIVLHGTLWQHIQCVMQNGRMSRHFSGH